VRILILGGDGMLGHQLLSSWNSRHEVRVTLRQALDDYSQYGLYDSQNSYYGVDVQYFEQVERVVDDFKPEAVVNAVGIVKQRVESHDYIQSLEVNSLLPHKLSVLCGEVGARLVHMSTDCVFSGDSGMYTEKETPDAADLYGRSKLLGEVSESHAVTLRTSIIGLELSRKKSLVEWFLQQCGTVRGFEKVIYSGFTTVEMARIIEFILTQQKELSGVWHVASRPVNKYDLLSSLVQRLPEFDIKIIPDDSFVCDRSLDGSKFGEVTGYQAPSWDKMLNELAQQVQERTQ